MCGIAGKLWSDAARPADTDGVARMIAAMAHRGPDGNGLAADGPLAFGHRRLSIVDLSERGSQPMRSGDCLLVCNGEIYNHLELRAELSARGHRFTSDCDNEVLLALYQEHWEQEGVDFLARVEGMYAFALWDGAARRLLLARDRTGQKPLVYAQTDQGLVFASELPALMRDADVPRAPDWQALSDYLAYRVVPHPATAYAGVAKLRPGHALVVEDGAVRTECHWRLSPGSDVTTPPDLHVAADEVLDRLRAAVRRRLMSDVPVGAFLSGGMDSAAVVALMAEATGGPISTFTIGFRQASYDEAAGARKVARIFGTDHHEELVEPDAVSLLDEVLAHHGEPFADSSSIPTFLVSRLARQHGIKVVLTGDGGDESFAGYDRYRALALAERMSGRFGLPARLAVGVASAFAALGGAGGGRGLANRLSRFHTGLAHGPRQRNHIWRLGLGGSMLDRLLTPEGRERLGPPGFYGPDIGQPLSLNEALVLDVERYLPDDILGKLDTATMAHGVEARSPFLDRALMEYAASLPGRYKLGGGVCGFGATSKRVLRAALAGLLPADVLSGRKRGFGVPLDAWFRGPLAEPAREVLLSRSARERGLFRPDAVEALIDGHVRNRVAAHEPLLTLWVLERWFQQEDSIT
jgi:asparagine synthase (glutamine-hydrolysing)